MNANHEKPTVHFAGEPFFETWDLESGPIEVAHVYGLNHPRLGRQHIRTSRVLQKFDDGSFETLNTLYKPEAA